MAMHLNINPFDIMYKGNAQVFFYLRLLFSYATMLILKEQNKISSSYCLAAHFQLPDSLFANIHSS